MARRPIGRYLEQINRRSEDGGRGERAEPVQASWPTRFHIAIAGLSSDLSERRRQIRESIETIWNSPYRNFCLDPLDIRSISTIAQGNANSAALPADVVSTEPGGADVAMDRMLSAFYTSPQILGSPRFAYLDYEPRENYVDLADQPLYGGFITAEQADGKAALQHFADLQKPILEQFGNQVGRPIRYGIYWLEVATFGISGTNTGRYIASAQNGAFEPFDDIFAALYAFYEDTVDNLTAHYQSYYNASVAASSAAVAAGYSPFDTIPLFRVREQHEPGVAELTDNQAAAIGKFLALSQPANACFWYQYASGDSALLGCLSKVYDSYVANLA